MLRQSSSTADMEFDGCGSTPYLNNKSRVGQAAFDVKVLSPDSRRKLFARKPGGERQIQTLRSRKLAEESKQLASFYSPTSHRQHRPDESETSMFQDGLSLNMTFRTANSRPSQQHLSSCGSLKTFEEKSSQAASQKPRLSARIQNPQQTQPAATVHAPRVSVKMEDTNLKKIKILEIQLEAANLQNSRLKQHITLLRSHNQEIKSVAVTEVGALTYGLMQHAQSMHQQRKSPGNYSSRAQNISEEETDRLKRACIQLTKELGAAREELEQERQRLAGSVCTLQESEKRLKEQLVQLESIIAINRRQYSMLKSTNQQLTVRMWNLNRQIAQLQATEKEHSHLAKSLLKKQRIAKNSLKMQAQRQYDEREDELFQLSPQREQ